MGANKPSPFYKPIKWLIRTFYSRTKIVGAENLPEEPALIVGNHCHMHGPIVCELYFPGLRYTWCAGAMMHRKEVAAYAFQDFWSGKPKWSHWFYRILSHMIVPLALCIFNSANTIGVYHDARIISTFKNTVNRLSEGANVVVFPEHLVERNHIIHEFQDKFIDVAKLYYKRTGKRVSFVPMYIAPALKSVYLGKPICFDPEAPMELERRRICEYLMEQVTRIACELPEHRVVPYPNVSKKLYPTNREKENVYEKTGG